MVDKKVKEMYLHDTQSKPDSSNVTGTPHKDHGGATVHSSIYLSTGRSFIH